MVRDEAMIKVCFARGEDWGLGLNKESQGNKVVLIQMTSLRLSELHGEIIRQM